MIDGQSAASGPRTAFAVNFDMLIQGIDRQALAHFCKPPTAM